jgi:hypothetical protein
MKRTWIFLALVLSLPLGWVGAAAAEDKAAQNQPAVAAAEAWLALVDQGKYDESWTNSAAFFRSKVPQAAWKKQIESARALFGKFEKRRLKINHALTSLPGAPEGKYVLIQYDASFEKDKHLVETVTPMLDPDGKWRISGYFIKRGEEAQNLY